MPFDWMQLEAMVVVAVEVEVILRPTLRPMPMVFLNTANLISMGSVVVLAVPMVDVVVEGTASFCVVPMDCIGDNDQIRRQGRIQSMPMLRHRVPMAGHNRSASARPPIIGIVVMAPMAILSPFVHKQSAIIGNLTERVMAVFITMDLLHSIGSVQ